MPPRPPRPAAAFFTSTNTHVYLHAADPTAPIRAPSAYPSRPGCAAARLSRDPRLPAVVSAGRVRAGHDSEGEQAQAPACCCLSGQIRCRRWRACSSPKHPPTRQAPASQRRSQRGGDDQQAMGGGELVHRSLDRTLVPAAVHAHCPVAQSGWGRQGRRAQTLDRPGVHSLLLCSSPLLCSPGQLQAPPGGRAAAPPPSQQPRPAPPARPRPPPDQSCPDSFTTRMFAVT